jgi:hypothetical protein
LNPCILDGYLSTRLSFRFYHDCILDRCCSQVTAFHPGPFRSFLKYLYTDKLETTRHEARELIKIAAHYQCPQLKVPTECGRLFPTQMQIEIQIVFHNANF